MSADARLVANLPARGRVGTVHSVHERVVNVRVPDGRLCCLSTDDLEDAPRTIRVRADEWALLRWEAGDPVEVDLTAAVPWQPSPTDLSALDAEGLRRAAARMGPPLLPRTGSTPFESASADLLARRTADLGAALRAGDPERTTAAAAGLVGLGAGLTPSGDDVLAGLAVLAGARGMRLGAALPALREALTLGSPLEDRTTAVAAAMLTEAVDGRMRQRVHDLLDAIPAGAPSGAAAPRLSTAVRHVRAIGHASGADILTGIRLGLAVEADLREADRLAASSPTHPKENP